MQSFLYILWIKFCIASSSSIVDASELSNKIDGEAAQGEHHDPVIDAPGLDHVGANIDAEEDDEPGEDEERGTNGQHLLASIIHGDGSEWWSGFWLGSERGDEEHLTATSPRPGSVMSGSGQGERLGG